MASAAAASGRMLLNMQVRQACVRQRRMEVAWAVDEFGSKDEKVKISGQNMAGK